MELRTRLPEFVDEAVQFGTPVEEQINSYRLSVSRTVKRKDVLEIKRKLQEHVQDNDYWTVLTRFIHGEIPKIKFDDAMRHYLRTNEAKNIHNEFIRAIIFNAHFSPIPPPGVTVSAYSFRPHIPAQEHIAPAHFKTPEVNLCLAQDLGHIPNAAQILKRIAMIPPVKGVKIDNDVGGALMLGLRYYIMRFLSSCINGEIRNWSSGTSSITVGARHIASAIRNDKELAGLVSPSILAKIPIH